MHTYTVIAYTHTLASGAAALEPDIVTARMKKALRETQTAR